MVRRADEGVARPVDRAPGRPAGLGARLLVGLLAGIVAGLALTLVFVVLRVAAGVPLPVELISDRVLPQLGVRTFVRLLGRVGGPLRGKNLAFLSSFAIQVGAAAAGGLLFGWLRPRGRSSEGRAQAPGWPWPLVALPLAVLWLVAVVLLWPVLESNYLGLTPGWARLAAAAGLLLGLEMYGAVLVAAYRGTIRQRPEAPPSAPPAVVVGRRTLLIGGAGLVAAVAAGGLSALLYRRATFGAFGYDGLQLRGPHIDPITPNERFYVVTKNLIDPRPVDSLWRLQVTGMVERPRSYSFEQLARLPSVDQEQTLECISNRVGGGLISNAVWTGVPLRNLIEPAGPRPGVSRVAMHGSDGFVHTLSVDKALQPTTVVAYRMNGQPLPLRHGYPARVLVPGTYGEVSVKWVDRIDLSAEPIEGYYEQQGWKPYFVNTMSRIDSPRNGQEVSLSVSPDVEISGIAFAGERGISRVEVQSSDSTRWQPARLVYSSSPLAWSLWRLSWGPPGPGRYRLTVRAADGNGDLQTPRAHGAVPAGATGYHAVTVVVRA